jgi:type IV secretory pathway TraG/TraD family ATPase VirD4
MLRWYLRQGWATQLVVIAIVVVMVPILWTAIASYLFLDLMGNGLRRYYPRGDIGSYLVWWDYFLADGQRARVRLWLAVSAAVAALPFVAFIARQVIDHVGGTKRPSLYGSTGWASSHDMRRGGVKTKREVF